ncbi:MAG: imidazole glycerol phosphate synthase subunit HisH [Verrucomicrobiota bacterium]
MTSGQKTGGTGSTPGLNPHLPSSMIGILNYEIGNLRSVQKALEHEGAPTKWVRTEADLAGCDGLVLPGVGAFGDCVKEFRATGLEGAVRDWIAADRPFFGICVGYQMLFEASDESPDVPGLGVFGGQVVRFDDRGRKVPQIGWNTVQVRQPQSPFLEGIADGAYFYFVHSYYPQVAEADRPHVALEADYGVPFAAAITRGRLFATQFHPEKSQANGLRLLGNFVKMTQSVAA